LIYEAREVVAGEGGVVVDLAVLALGRGPAFPAVGFIEDVVIFLAFELGLGGFVGFEGIEIFQKEQPRGLLGVIEFAGAACFFSECIVDVFESLLEHNKLLGFEKGSKGNYTVGGML